jgi:hypothetical protein
VQNDAQIERLMMGLFLTQLVDQGIERPLTPDGAIHQFGGEGAINCAKLSLTQQAMQHDIGKAAAIDFL